MSRVWTRRLEPGQAVQTCGALGGSGALEL